MSDEFCIPAKPADLLNEDAALPIKVRPLQAFEEAPATEIDEYAEGMQPDDLGAEASKFLNGEFELQDGITAASCCPHCLTQAS